MYGIPHSYIVSKSAQQWRTAKERAAMLRDGVPPLDLTNKTVFIVDDGIATGMTTRAAVLDVLARRPRKLIVAAPVAAKDTVEQLLSIPSVHVAVPLAPPHFRAVGNWYNRFDQARNIFQTGTEDEEALAIVRRRRAARGDAAGERVGLLGSDKAARAEAASPQSSAGAYDFPAGPPRPGEE
eukprot:tig00020563_g11203.t1